MTWSLFNIILDNKVDEANLGPTWVLSAPDGPHVGPMNFAIRDGNEVDGELVNSSKYMYVYFWSRLCQDCATESECNAVSRT